MVPSFVTFPLFVGIPGGAELLILLLIALVVFGLPVVLLGGGLYLYRQSQSERPTSEEIGALRREVERLREDIQQTDDDRLTNDESVEEQSDDESTDDRSDDDQ